MLFSVCLSTFSGAPALAADPHPLVPPLACCSDSRCPCHTQTCVGLPYIPACDPAVDGATAGPAWNLTLQEAINTALANSEAVRNLGLVEAASRNDLVRSLTTTYDPMAAYAEAAGEWGIFDPLWTTEMFWDKQDIPPGTSFSGIGNRPPQLDTADFYTGVEQLLPIGTRVRADLVTDYLFNPANPLGLDPNPQYFSYHQFGVTQPLLKGFGVDVTMAPIKIACAEAERTDWQFKQEMLAMVRSIETTYWALYAQQQNLKAIEQVLPHFREIVRLRQEQASGTVGTESEVARAQSEMYLYEQRRLDTMSKVAENALVLRNLMGLPPDDCREIVLLAVPVTTRPFETLQNAVNTAVNSRPDVLRQRLAVYVAGQERILAENVLKPQLDLNGYWRTNGLGEDLEESWESKDTNNFNDWHMGFFFQVPLGRRLGRAELRAAELRISRERAMLDQTAHQASYEVADAYRRLNWTYQQLQISGNRQQALNQWSQGAKATFDNPPPGMTTVFALELYLSNLRDITDASISQSALLADYNSALARLEEVKGTLLENRMIVVAGDTSDTLPSQLPPADIQLPESVQPAPAQPAPQAAPPAQPQGNMIAPPAEGPVEIAREPQPQQAAPLPMLAMPESVRPAPNAYSDLPVTPTPQVVAEPMVEAPPAMVERAPMIAPQPLAMPAIEMPPSLLPEPAYTAMQPAPMAAPEVEMPAPAPIVGSPMAEVPAYEAPMAETPMVQQPAAIQPYMEAPVAEAPLIEEPIVEAPAIEQPRMLAPPQETEMVREAPRAYSRSQDGTSLAMPQSVLPPGAYASGSPVYESQAEAARRIPQPAAEPMRSASLQMPRSILVNRPVAPNGNPPGAYASGSPEAHPPGQPMPQATLQMPGSMQAAAQGAAASAPMQLPTSVRPQARSAAPQPMRQAPRQQAGPQLQMPSSVRPATAEAPTPIAQRSLGLQFPGSVSARR